MYGNKRGQWMEFGSRDNSSAGTVRLSTSCISTSAESLGHYTTVRSTGKIVSIDEELTVSPQTSQDAPAHGQE